VAAKPGGINMIAAFVAGGNKLVLKIRCKRSCWWRIINICNSSLYKNAIALLS